MESENDITLVTENDTVEENITSDDRNNCYNEKMTLEEITYAPCNLKLGDKAPNFIAISTLGECSLSDYKGRWLVFFSHPGDFTPVCTTEFLAFSKYYSNFKNINCELLGLSVDSNASHLAWIYDIYKNTGVQIQFPIIEDRDAKIASMYGMIAPNINTKSTIRCVYVICPKGNIRAMLYYPHTNGRNISEILRLVQALQETDSQEVLTPANWLPNMPTITYPPTTYPEVLERLKANNACSDWYLCFNNNSTVNENPNM